MEKIFYRQTFRLYPSTEQVVYFNQEIGNQRFVWNHFLAENIKQYQEHQKFIFYGECASQLVLLKKEKEWLKLGNSQSLQQTLKDFEKALKMSFKDQISRKGFPKFKKKHNGGSFRVPQHFSVTNGSIKLPKIGEVRYTDNGTGTPIGASSVTIIKKPSGKWFASFVLPIELPDKIPLGDCTKIVGIDLNSNDIVVTSNGERVNNPKHIKEKERKLKSYQRRFSRCAKGSQNQKKVRVKLAKIHEKVANQSKDFIEKLTLDIVKENDIICIEDLNVKAMQKWNGRMIQSAPFAMIRSKLAWKTNKLGRHLVVIGRYEPSSKMCSSCGQLHDMPPNIRWLSCDCGNEIHRDHNAAINIRQMGLQQIDWNTSQIGQELPELDTPPEILRLQSRNTQWESVEPKGSVKEETSKSLASR